MSKRPNRLGTFSVGALQLMLTPRDIAIVKSVREYKFFATKQICALHFADHASYVSAIRACTRVLARLRERRLLYRLDRPIGGGGGGSTSYAWGVDAAGDRLIRADPDGEHTTRFRPYQPTPPFLAHALAIADVRVRVGDMERAGQLELLEAVTEPSNWRPFQVAGRMAILKPDLLLITAIDDEEWVRYVEVDRGTESLQVLLAKCRVYQQLADTGADQDRYGTTPQTLWLIPTEKRAARFREELAADERLDDRLHRIIPNGELESELAADLVSGPMPEEGGA